MTSLDALLRGPAARGRNAAARFLVTLPEPVVEALAGPRPRDGIYRLAPDLTLLLRMARAARLPEIADLDPERARRHYARDGGSLDAVPPAAARITNLAAAGPAGPVPLRLYVPTTAGPRPPVCVWFHGGGHVIGSLETHEAGLRRLAHRSGTAILAVDYRLAPEAPFPAAVGDAVAGYLHAKRHAARLGVDPDRVGVGGDSAGGNLAAVVAQLVHGDEAPDLQVLLYPFVNDAFDEPSYRAFGEGYLLSARTIDWFREHYTGGDRAVSADPRFCPAKAPSLAGLPRALVVTAAFDPLRDQGRAYAARLRAAGVDVREHVSGDTLHGFLTMGALRSCDRAHGELAAMLADAWR